MDNFLFDDNPLKIILIQLAARGNAIIAELLRLKDYIPDTYKLNNKLNQQKYGEVISDFLYFKNSDEFEKKIEKNLQLQQVDAEIRDNNLEILNRFFLTFESIHKYANDLNQFADELKDGIYVQQSLEDLFLDGECNQLLCEILFLYGVMLLVLDIYIDGIIRERLLVSYYRYCTQRFSETATVDDICKLMRSTGYETNKRPLEYPTDYFRRIPINRNLINLVINHLRTDDIYNQISAYPCAEHRSTALSSQGIMLFICLFFDSNILIRQSGKMREIVDKFFSDNWVIGIYMGITVNIIDMWDPFKAAKAALGNTLEIDNIHSIQQMHSQKFKKYLKQTHELLKKEALIKDKVYENIDAFLILCRDCNVTLRWLILHTIPHYSVFEMNKRCKQIREQILSDIKLDKRELLQFLLNIAEYELTLKELFKKLLKEKEINWNFWKTECVQRMRELSDAFTGEKPLTKISKNENLQIWFREVSLQIESLSLEKRKGSSRKILQLLRALKNVQGFHRLSLHHQVSEYISETCKYLQYMDRTLNIEDDILVNLQIIGDFSYAWNAIDNFTELMQELIKTDPSSAVKLKALFLKLSSALETPLIRINQAGGNDLVSVSQYYSQELVMYIRNVLHIIPETMFLLMTQIIHLQTNIIEEIPVRLEKEKIKDYAQLNERMKVARLTHDVSVLSEGILKMESTLVGIVKINPKKLLEDGIRRELVKYIAVAFHNNVSFNSRSKGSNLISVLKVLNDVMDGYRRSFEYIQDYIGIYGLKIWQEELSRIISYNVEMECNKFLKNKIQSWQSVYQNKMIPIPDFPKTEIQCENFMGRLVRELIRVTDPKLTVYVENSMSWFDYKTQNEVLNFKVFEKIKNSFGISGLIGIDKLIGFMIVSKLQNFLNVFQKEIIKEKIWNEMFDFVNTVLKPNTTIDENSSKVYGRYLGKFYKVTSVILDSILEIGQLQILRSHIFYELEIACKFDSKQLYSCLNTMNTSLLNEMKSFIAEDQSQQSLNESGTLLGELCSFLSWGGIGNPYQKIYVTTGNIPNFSLFMSFFTIFQLSKLQWQNNIGSLIWKKYNEPLDGMPFIVGLQTLFYQFHADNRLQFLLYVIQYFNSSLLTVASGSIDEKLDISNDLRTILEFLYLFANYSEIASYFSQEMVHLLETL